MSPTPRTVRKIRNARPAGAAERVLSPQDIHQSIFMIKVLDLANSIDRAAGMFYGKRFGLRVADLRVLVHAARAPGLSLVEISRRARIDRAWISRSVQRLEKRELARKRPVAGDDRAYGVYLTDKGMALLRQLIPIVQHRERKFLAGENQKELERIVERLTARIEEMMLNDEAEWERGGPGS
jgi:DNA-binding MarR family transcriptional regulator